MILYIKFIPLDYYFNKNLLLHIPRPRLQILTSLPYILHSLSYRPYIRRMPFD